MAIRRKSVGRRILLGAVFVLFLPVIVPLVTLALLLSFLNRVIVYLLVWICWLLIGKDVLYVSSESPIWKEYMETEILPLVAERAILLNWSARTKWRRWSLTVRVFRTFGGEHDFNPIVVLFRPLRRATIFRFLPAFEKLKRGNRADLDRLRRDLVEAL